MSGRLIGLIASAVALALGSIAPAQDGVLAGTLECDISAGNGLILGSQRTVSCTFTPSTPGPVEHYTGTLSTLGLDVGATTGGAMTWLVYAPTSRPLGALAGEYGGATAEATVGAGLGAKVLVGGSNSTIALQPLSVQGQTGFNVAAGVAGLQLSYTR
ncbi:MAG: DUF992 domain-containing protein [Bradyrhizobiaceae bacterium]|nr:DUF992 domain-containing protein [Bradyrhizobiaceae bacterium]